MSVSSVARPSEQILMSTEFFDVIERPDSIAIRTKVYSDTLVEIIKSLHSSRRWNSLSSEWVFSKDAKDVILQKLSKIFGMRTVGKTIIGGVEADVAETDSETVFVLPRMLDLPVFKSEIEKMNGRRLATAGRLYVYIPKGYEKLFYEAFEKTIGRVQEKPVIVVTYSDGSPRIGDHRIINYDRDSHDFASHPSYEPLVDIRMFSRGSARYPAYHGIVAISTRLPHLISNYEHRVDLPDTPEARKKLFDLIDKYFGKVKIKGANYKDVADKKVAEGFFAELKKISEELVARTEADDEIAKLEKEIEELERMLQEKRRRLEELRMKREAARLV